jgi:hypothetical protein
MSNGWSHTGYPWNHWGTGQPSTPETNQCIASSMALRFWQYNVTGNNTRVNDTTDPSNNVSGWPEPGRHSSAGRADGRQLQAPGQHRNCPASGTASGADCKWHYK